MLVFLFVDMSAFVPAAATGWSRGVEYEVSFWDRWLKRGRARKRGLWHDDFMARMNGSTPFHFAEHLLNHRNSPNQTSFIALDVRIHAEPRTPDVPDPIPLAFEPLHGQVGAGPIEGHGYTLPPPLRLELIPTDALAKEYDALLARHRIVPCATVPTACPSQ